MTKDTFREYIKPFVVLVGICLVVAFLLAFTNDLTAPVIEENARIEAEKTRMEVLEGAVGFDEVDCDTEALGIVSAYRESSGLGYVISASANGYKGPVLVTVGIDDSGSIVGIKADVGTETSGIGSKAGEESYLKNFLGITGSSDGIDTITNATYSSLAVKTGVDTALKAYEAIKGE